MKCCEAQNYEGYDKRSVQQVILECVEEECGVQACQNRQLNRQVQCLEKKEKENVGKKTNHPNPTSEVEVKSGISSGLIIICIIIVLLAILIPLLTKKA